MLFAARPYLAVFAARFLMMLQYRAAALAGMTTQFWFGAIMVMSLAAFYASAHGAPPLTLTQTITYVWLGQAFLGLLPWNVDSEIVALMRNGNVAYERLRPVNTYFYWYVRAAAWRVANTLLRSVPLLMVTALVLPLLGFDNWALQPPAGAAALGMFALSMIAVVLLSAAITTLVNISVVWTVSGQGVNSITGSLVLIFSGMVIPLPLFPAWAHDFLFAQPFAGLVDIPYRIYFGSLAGAEALSGIGLQLGWTAILIALGQLFMTRVMSRIQMQGG